MQISITRGEGPSAECGKRHECQTFIDADLTLRKWSDTAPEHGGYDKCDFVIRDESIDLHYDGRYDLKHWRCESPNLKEHVLSYLAFLAGRRCPAHMSKERYDSLLSGTFKYTQQDMDKTWEVHEYLKGKS